ncbi:MAG: nitrate/nitrite transporter NrtS [Gammaproteobacteria bacterium]|jgi:Mg/Co/Ni transporter MgtE
MGDSWFKLATRPEVVRRAFRTALVVGCILVAINHGDALMLGDVGSGRLLQMGLTFLVPYLVSTSASVGTLRGGSKVPTE